METAGLSNMLSELNKAMDGLSWNCQQLGGNKERDTISAIFHGQAGCVPNSITESLPNAITDSLANSIKESLPNAITKSLPNAINSFAGPIPNDITRSIPDAITGWGWTKPVEQNVPVTTIPVEPNPPMTSDKLNLPVSPSVGSEDEVSEFTSNTKDTKELRTKYCKHILKLLEHNNEETTPTGLAKIRSNEEVEVLNTTAVEALRDVSEAREDDPSFEVKESRDAPLATAAMEAPVTHPEDGVREDGPQTPCFSFEVSEKLRSVVSAKRTKDDAADDSHPTTTAVEITPDKNSQGAKTSSPCENPVRKDVSSIEGFELTVSNMENGEGPVESKPSSHLKRAFAVLKKRKSKEELCVPSKVNSMGSSEGIEITNSMFDAYNNNESSEEESAVAGIKESSSMVSSKSMLSSKTMRSLIKNLPKLGLKRDKSLRSAKSIGPKHKDGDASGINSPTSNLLSKKRWSPSPTKVPSSPKDVKRGWSPSPTKANDAPRGKSSSFVNKALLNLGKRSDQINSKATDEAHSSEKHDASETITSVQGWVKSSTPEATKNDFKLVTSPDVVAGPEGALPLAKEAPKYFINTEGVKRPIIGRDNYVTKKYSMESFQSTRVRDAVQKIEKQIEQQPVYPNKKPSRLTFLPASNAAEAEIMEKYEPELSQLHILSMNSIVSAKSMGNDVLEQLDAEIDILQVLSAEGEDLTVDTCDESITKLNETRLNELKKYRTMVKSQMCALELSMSQG